MTTEIILTDTIRDVKESEWDSVAGTYLADRSHGWFRTLEDSGTRNMRYVFLKEEGRLKAAACCYLYEEHLLNLEMPFLDVKVFSSHTPLQAKNLIKGLKSLQSNEEARGLAFLQINRKEFETVRDLVRGSIRFPTEEETYIDLDFENFDDYLSSLKSSARRSARKTLNRAAKRWKIRTVFTDEFSRWKSVAHRLHGYLCEKHDEYRSYFPEQFYEALEKNLKEKAEMMLLFKDGIPLAFDVSLNSSTVSQHALLGLDPEYREYHAYFLCYYESIKRAIQDGKERIYFGPTSYEFKERIGCQREPLFGLLKLKNPLLNLALRSYIKIFKS